MSRPAKATVDYFPHYVNHGKTMFTLESKYGNDGYAFWFKLLELLGGSEHHYLNCNDVSDWEYLCAKTRLSEETVTDILNLLSKLGTIDPILWKNRIIRSNHFIENLQFVYSRREVNVYNNEDLLSYCMQKPNLIDHNVDKNPIDNNINEVNVDKNPQSKVKESKVKESKVKESNQYSFLSDFFIKLLKKDDVKYDEKNLSSWNDTFKKLVEVDKRDIEEIKKVCQWTREDNFWKSNFFSPLKLRKKDKEGTIYYERFRQEMKNKTTKNKKINNNFLIQEGNDDEISVLY